MEMIMNQEVGYLNSKNKAYLAMKTVFAFFVFIFWCLKVDIYGTSFSFLSFNLGRTHIFILCNGIVFILVKSSILSTQYEEGDGADQNVKKIKEEAVGSIEKENLKISNDGFVLIDEIEKIDLQLVEVVEEEEDGSEDDEEEEDDEELSVEELNKRCDEFIRRMKSLIYNGDGVF